MFAANRWRAFVANPSYGLGMMGLAFSACVLAARSRLSLQAVLLPVNHEQRAY